MKIGRFVEDFLENDDAFGQTLRVCSECGKAMQSGFMAYPEYYCSEEHLYKHITEREYLLAYLMLREEDMDKYVEGWTSHDEATQLEELRKLSDEWRSWASDDYCYTDWEDGPMTTLLAMIIEDCGLDFREKDKELDIELGGFRFLEPLEMTKLIDHWVWDHDSIPNHLSAICLEKDKLVLLDNATGDCWVNEYDTMEELLENSFFKEFYEMVGKKNDD